MSDDDASDLELLRAWQRNDARAGAVLVRRHSPRLLRFFSSKVGVGAEDLCQQTWAACLEAGDRIDDDGAGRSFRCYLFAAARNRLYNHFRSLQRDADRFDPLVMSVANVGGGPSTMVDMSERQQRLQEALQQLPVETQITLELHYWEHLTTREIADVLDVPEGTIKARLSRARRQLHDELSALE